MRTHNAIERLAAVAPPEPLLDSGHEDRILQRILGSDPPTVRRRHRAIALVLVGAVLVAAVVAVALSRGNGAPSAINSAGNHIALSGAQVEAAGFHFRTPAGFKRAADTSCAEPVTTTPPSGPVTDGFTEAASADGGCVAAEVKLSPPTNPIPTPAGQPVDVGSYQGYYEAPGIGEPRPEAYKSEVALYVHVELGGPAVSTYLVLYGEGLTEEQMIAVAESGLESEFPANQ